MRGGADEAFLRALIDNRNLGDISIRNTGDSNPEGKGSFSKFGKLLLYMSTCRGFEEVTDILIVCDSDIDPEENFNNLVRQICTVENQSVMPAIQFVAPTVFLTPSMGSPTLRVLSLPWIDEPGNLECLCVDAAKDTTAHARHVDVFGNSTGAYFWPSHNSVGKFSMRAILAATNERDPSIGIGKLWEGGNKDRFVPLGHSSFNRVADVLNVFLSR